MRKANFYLGILTIAMGVLIIMGIFSKNLTLIVKGLPGPGFFPFWLALGIILLGIILLGGLILKGSIKKPPKDATSDTKDESPFKKEEVYNFAVIIGSSVGVILITPFLGLLTSLGIAVGAMTRLFGEEKWTVVILVAVGSTVVFHAVFKLFLGVPLPVGPLNF